MGRFINADTFASTGQGLLGNNMFTYCNNNPVIYSDPTGLYFGVTSNQIKNSYLLDSGYRGSELANFQKAAGNFTAEVNNLYESAVDVYNSDAAQGLLAANKIRTGIRSVSSGLVGIVAPEVVATKLYGVAKFTYGFSKIVRGIIDLVDIFFDGR